MNNIPLEDIIEINEGIINEWLDVNPQAHDRVGVNKNRLQEVLDIVNKQNSPMLKAVYLMAGIAWAQPFHEGNKRTGSIVADTFLRMNGFKLVITEEDIEYPRSLLFEIQEERGKLNDDVLSKIMLYVAKRIVKV